MGRIWSIHTMKQNEAIQKEGGRSVCPGAEVSPSYMSMFCMIPFMYNFRTVFLYSTYICKHIENNLVIKQTFTEWHREKCGERDSGEGH